MLTCWLHSHTHTPLASTSHSHTHAQSAQVCAHSPNTIHSIHTTVTAPHKQQCAQLERRGPRRTRAQAARTAARRQLRRDLGAARRPSPVSVVVAVTFYLEHLFAPPVARSRSPVRERAEFTCMAHGWLEEAGSRCVYFMRSVDGASCREME